MHYKIHYGNSTVKQSVSREARVKYSKKQQKTNKQKTNKNKQKNPHDFSIKEYEAKSRILHTIYKSHHKTVVFHSFAGCYKNKHRLYFSNRRLFFVAAVVEGRECFI